jgi:hypothetical protein
MCNGFISNSEHLLLHAKLRVDVIEHGGVGDLVRKDAVSGVHALEPLDGLGELAALARGGDEGGIGDVVEGDTSVEHVERVA